MFASALLCALLLGAEPPTNPAISPEERRAYEEAKLKAGRNADAQVKLALWCETHGLKAERLKHLALAVLTDPKQTAARGLMGLVSHRGEWLKPEKVGEKIKADEALSAKLAEYNARR